MALWIDRKSGWPSRQQWFDYALIGVLLLTIGNGLVMWAERIVPSGTAALIVATVPVWILVLEGLRPHGAPWTARVWVGTVIGLAGRGARGAAGAGDGLAATGSRSWGCSSPVSRGRSARSTRSRCRRSCRSSRRRRSRCSPARSRSARCRGSWARTPRRLAAASPRAWGAFAYLIVVGSLVGFTAFAYCLNELPATTVGTYAYVNPVVAVFLGWLILGESLTPGLLAGGALIVLSVVLTTLRKRCRGNSGILERVLQRQRRRPIVLTRYSSCIISPRGRDRRHRRVQGLVRGPFDRRAGIGLQGVVTLLEGGGVSLGFPYSSARQGSRYGLRELRIQHQGRPYRVLYAFDPERQAVLLLGGDKTGYDRFYEEYVPKAEVIWERYLAERGREERSDVMAVHRFKDLKHKMSRERQERLRADARAELLEMDLRGLRELLGKTQEELAALLERSQSQVSETERRQDVLLSTLRSYVKALGGELEVIANFGDKRIRLHSA